MAAITIITTAIAIGTITTGSAGAKHASLKKPGTNARLFCAFRLSTGPRGMTILTP
jgi:hypothetical protein